MDCNKVLNIVLSTCSLSGYTQTRPDSVVVPLAKSSKIILTVGDSSDLEILRHYDFGRLFDDVLLKLEQSHGIIRDSTPHVSRIPGRQTDEQPSRDEDRIPDDWNEDEVDDDDQDENDGKWDRSRRGRIGQTWQSYNIDLGTNNYLSGDQFPDGSEPYAVRPWGSWYIAGNSVQRTRLGKNIFVEWGLGVSWYNFKFQENNIRLGKDEFGVRFEADQREVDYIKSKLSATFINASLVPVLDFSDRTRKGRVWDHDRGGFRFGIGPYVGYRIASKSKLVYEENGDREKDKERDSFYLNNLRYGFRLQLGVRSTDLFINYDMNDLFADQKGPAVKAISFGLVF